MRRAALIEGGEAASELFRYAFTRRALESYDALARARLLPDSILDAGLLPVPVEGNRNLAHYEDCSTVVDAAIEGKLHAPVATLRAAVSSSFKATSSLVLVAGRFQSPLAFGLSSSNTFANRLSKYLWLWQWYRDHEAYSDSSLSYVDVFRGVALMRFAQQGRQRTFDLTGEAGVGLGVVSVRGKSHVNLFGSSLTTFKGYSTLIYMNDERNAEVSFAPLPSPVRIAREAGAARLELASGRLTVSPDVPDTLRYELPGVPTALCDRSEWTIGEQRVKGRLLLSSVKPRSENETPKCSFEVVYTPDRSDLAGTRGTVPLGFALVAREQVNGTALRLATETTVSTAEGPTFRVIPGDRHWSVSGHVADIATLSWSAEAQVLDKEGFVNARSNAYEIAEQRLVCEGEPIPVRATVSSQTALSYQLGIATDWRSSRVDTSARARVRACQFSAEVGIPLSEGGRKAWRSVQVPLLAPRHPDNAPRVVEADIGEAELLALPTVGRDLQRDTAVSGTLGDHDPLLSDSTHAQAWVVHASRGERLSIKVVSQDFDTYLYLVGGGLKALMEDDDGGGGTNSEIRLLAPEDGAYVVVVNSVLRQEGGRFTLRIGRLAT